MGLSGETVIVCGCGLTRAPWLTDVCVCQLPTSPGRLWGEGERDRTTGTVSHFSSCHLIHD